MEDMVMFGGVYRGRRVLVTGHTGFKGSWLSQWLLALGSEVSGIALAPETTPNLFTIFRLAGRLDHHVVDVRDAQALAATVGRIRPEVVFHLAAQPLVRRSYQLPKDTFDINVGGTVNLLEAVRACPGVRASVVVTSDKCYENREWDRGYREDDALGGYDPYSASKGAAELVVASYRRSFFHPAGIHLASARAGNVIGGGDWSPDRLVTDFIAALATGRDLELRSPHATRPWQHVLEPVSGYLLLAQKLLASGGERFAEAWNFGPSDGGAATVGEVAAALSAAWGAGAVKAASDPARLHEAGQLKLDCAKARDRLGWHGIWPLAETVTRTVHWYRAHAAAGDIATFSATQISDYASAASAAGLSWATTTETRIESRR